MNPIPMLALQQTGMKPRHFSPTSRYYGLEIGTWTSVRQGALNYVRRRMIAQPEKFHLLQEHIVEAGERPDTLTYRYLHDPEQFWRIADANVVMRPEALTAQPGQIVRITLPGELSI